MTTTTETGTTPILQTRIPEGRAVPGVEYGAHVSANSWSGYYVRTGTCPQWGIARETPASDELVGGDRDILMALDDELEALNAQACYINAAIAEHGARAVHDAAMAHMDGSGSLATVGLYPETMADSWRILRAAMDRLPAESPDPVAIRKQRNRLGLSVAQCARRVEVADRTWRRWEAGERVMPADLWRSIQDW